MTFVYWLPSAGRHSGGKRCAGSPIPIKLSLSGYKEMAVLATGYPMSQPVSRGSGLRDAIEQTIAADASSLSYDAATVTYTSVWKTDPAWRGRA